MKEDLNKDLLVQIVEEFQSFIDGMYMTRYSSMDVEIYYRYLREAVRVLNETMPDDEWCTGVAENIRTLEKSGKLSFIGKTP